MRRAGPGTEPDPAGGRVTSGRGAADRVRLSHAQTRATLKVALVFIAAAAAAAPFVDTRWLPLHLFLAGGLMLAISGVSLMLAVTWSAAPAPSGRSTTVQRWCIALGAAGIAAGREGELADAAIGVAGGVYLVGMVMLGWLLLRTIRRGVERRFDMAVAAYLVALAAGIVGVALGVAMATDAPSITKRGAHVTLNLLGLVGMVVAGTMPYFAATVGRSRMSHGARPRNLAITLVWLTAALAVAVIALLADAGKVATFGFVGFALGVLAVLWLLPRPTRRQLKWAGPRLLALWCGAVWWIAAIVATAFDAAAGDVMVFGGRWVLVLALGGYAQILWGSLAYLLPMLRGGGHERLAAGFASTRSWLGLAAVNSAAVSIATGLPGTVAAAATTIWVIDTAWRFARVGAATDTINPSETRKNTHPR